MTSFPRVSITRPRTCASLLGRLDPSFVENQTLILVYSVPEQLKFILQCLNVHIAAENQDVLRLAGTPQRLSNKEVFTDVVLWNTVLDLHPVVEPPFTVDRTVFQGVVYPCHLPFIIQHVYVFPWDWRIVRVS